MDTIKIRPTIPDNVLIAYTQKHRFYHDITHILNMTSVALNVDLFPDEPLTMEEKQILLWDIFYHDIVYNVPDPERRNEESSATQFLIDHPNYEHKDLVAEHVLATRTHIIDPDSSDRVLKCLIDLDLWELADYNRYQNNNALIKQEVGAAEEDWLIGRSNWIEQFLQRDRIYYTPVGKQREQKARDILKNDLEDLRSRLHHKNFNG